MTPTATRPTHPRPVRTRVADRTCRHVPAARSTKGPRSGRLTDTVRTVRRVSRPSRLVPSDAAAALHRSIGGLSPVLAVLAEPGCGHLRCRVHARDNSPYQKETKHTDRHWRASRERGVDSRGDRGRRPLRGESGRGPARRPRPGWLRDADRFGAAAADADRARRQLQRAQCSQPHGRPVAARPGRSAAAHAAGLRWHQGLPCPARFQRRPDAAVGGDAATADPHRRRRHGRPYLPLRSALRRAALGRHRPLESNGRTHTAVGSVREIPSVNAAPVLTAHTPRPASGGAR